MKVTVSYAPHQFALNQRVFECDDWEYGEDRCINLIGGEGVDRGVVRIISLYNVRDIEIEPGENPLPGTGM